MTSARFLGPTLKLSVSVELSAKLQPFVTQMSRARRCGTPWPESKSPPCDSIADNGNQLPAAWPSRLPANSQTYGRAKLWKSPVSPLRQNLPPPKDFSTIAITCEHLVFIITSKRPANRIGK